MNDVPALFSPLISLCVHIL